MKKAFAAVLAAMFMGALAASPFGEVVLNSWIGDDWFMAAVAKQEEGAEMFGKKIEALVTVYKPSDSTYVVIPCTTMKVACSLILLYAAIFKEALAGNCDGAEVVDEFTMTYAPKTGVPYLRNGLKMAVAEPCERLKWADCEEWSDCE